MNQAFELSNGDQNAQWLYEHGFDYDAEGKLNPLGMIDCWYHKDWDLIVTREMVKYMLPSAFFRHIMKLIQEKNPSKRYAPKK